MTNTQKKKIIAIVGPTASGKTGIGVKIAKEFNGEIISADSRQVYRGLDIGTGKDLKEYCGVKYHLIDIVEPGDDFSLFKYLDLARAAIEDIFSRGKTPIIVGGTGLYIQALIEGFKLKKQVISNKKQTNTKFYYREQLNNLSIEQLQNILQKIDAKTHEELRDKQNPHRLIRAIEKVQENLITTKTKPDFEVLQIGITWPREELYKRIDKRVEDRFKEGMLEEVENLLKSGVNIDWLIKLGLEYRIISLYLLYQEFKIKNQKYIKKLKIDKLIENCKLKNENFESFETMQQTLKYKIHQFARRQLTWFRRFSEIVWENDYKKIESCVKVFLKCK